MYLKLSDSNLKAVLLQRIEDAFYSDSDICAYFAEQILGLDGGAAKYDEEAEGWSLDLGNSSAEDVGFDEKTMKLFNIKEE